MSEKDAPTGPFRFRGDLLDCNLWVSLEKQTCPLLLVSISKKYFNAVKRNTIRRRIREYYRLSTFPSLLCLKIFIKKRFSLQDKKLLIAELDRLFAFAKSRFPLSKESSPC